MTKKELDSLETIIHGILYILNKIGGKCDKHKLFKIMYFSDREYLARYGRPIFLDKYIAMPYGPVPSYTLDVVNSLIDKRIKVKELNVSEYINLELPYDIVSLKEPDMDNLAESEVKVIDLMIENYKNHTFEELVRESHDSAWESASKNGVMNIMKIAKVNNLSKDMVDYIRDSIMFEKAALS